MSRYDIQLHDENAPAVLLYDNCDRYIMEAFIQNPAVDRDSLPILNQCSPSAISSIGSPSNMWTCKESHGKKLQQISSVISKT